MQYSPTQLTTALESIRRGSQIRNVSRSSGIPESTLRGRLNERYHRQKPGAPTALPSHVESYAVNWVLEEARRGFPVSTGKLIACVAHYIKKKRLVTKFKNGTPGKKWLQHFLRRHPNISRRIPSSLPKHRAIVTEKQIRDWFAEIKNFIRADKHEQILKDPTRVFNMDETAVRTVPTKEVVLAGTGIRHLHVRVGNSDKESYTALFAANASGALAPTMILFPYKQRIPGEIYRKLPTNWAAGRTDTGWMNQDTFYLYLRDVFHPWLMKKKIVLPVIVFVDGHKSHVSDLSTEFCKKSGIILICLSPNTTQITQPLDVSFFRPLKLFWNQLLTEWRIDHAGEVLPRCEIAPLLQKAIDKMSNLSPTLTNGFRRAGLYPFDVDAVDFMSLVSANNDAQTTHGGTSSMAHNLTHDFEHAEGNRQQFHEKLESYLTNGQLETFRANLIAERWTGPIEDHNLFLVWKKAAIRNGAEDETATTNPEEFNDSLESEPEFKGFENDSVEFSCPSQGAPNASIVVDAISKDDILNRSQTESKEVDEVLESSFKRPTPKRSIQNSGKVHPPSVATSKAYEEYVQKIETVKKNDENERQKKKDERTRKRKLKESEALRKKFDRFIKKKKKNV